MTGHVDHNELRHELRDPEGRLVAVHCRVRLPNGGKRVWWRRPSGAPGLGGIRISDLPLYGIDRRATWSPHRPLVITEGEPATDALRLAGFQAVAVVTGAAGCPSDEQLGLLEGLPDIVLWPDADVPGAALMDRVAKRLAALHPRSTMRRVEWTDAPFAGADAANANLPTMASLITSARLIRGNSPPRPRSPQTEVQDAASLGRSLPMASPYLRAIKEFNAVHGVCEVLASDWGVEEAEAGRTIRCPAHDDRSPSLSISADDRRVWCHSLSCVLRGNEGQGHDAFSLAVQARLAVPA